MNWILSYFAYRSPLDWFWKSQNMWIFNILYPDTPDTIIGQTAIKSKPMLRAPISKNCNIDPIHTIRSSFESAEPFQSQQDARKLFRQQSHFIDLLTSWPYSSLVRRYAFFNETVQWLSADIVFLWNLLLRSTLWFLHFVAYKYFSKVFQVWCLR